LNPNYFLEIAHATRMSTSACALLCHIRFDEFLQSLFSLSKRRITSSRPHPQTQTNMKVLFSRAQALFATNRYATFENGSAFLLGVAIIPAALGAAMHLSSSRRLPPHVPLQNGRTEGTKFERRAAAPAPLCSISRNHARMFRNKKDGDRVSAATLA
jgi:hypothetical protein